MRARTRWPWDNAALYAGPLDHSTNWPLRAGKGSEFEGGYRVWAMASGPVLPEAVRGTTYDGIMHSSDWLPTLVGVDAVSGAPLDVVPSSRGLDGFNLWPAIAGFNLTSARTEVIHAVNNQVRGGRCAATPDFCSPALCVALAVISHAKPSPACLCGAVL